VMASGQCRFRFLQWCNALHAYSNTIWHGKVRVVLQLFGKNLLCDWLQLHRSRFRILL
jgi:hypothetical protein